MLRVRGFFPLWMFIAPGRSTARLACGAVGRPAETYCAQRFTRLVFDGDLREV
ncbi:hypothetical protein ACFYVL_00120 [Streptomyces sp. NPDC004111]|uniref:hypothetical protein n=1 Tax=Streptomyces sp. NPDC004111 TaxID=3364690 RepID=UPI00368718AD